MEVYSTSKAESFVGDRVRIYTTKACDSRAFWNHVICRWATSSRSQCSLPNRQANASNVFLSAIPREQKRPYRAGCGGESDSRKDCTKFLGVGGSASYFTIANDCLCETYRSKSCGASKIGENLQCHRLLSSVLISSKKNTSFPTKRALSSGTSTNILRRASNPHNHAKWVILCTSVISVHKSSTIASCC